MDLNCSTDQCQELALPDSNYCSDHLLQWLMTNRINRIRQGKQLNRRMVKSGILMIFAAIIIAITVTWSQQAKADSVMCGHNIIYTETSSTDIQLDIDREVVKTKAIYYSNGWVQIHPWALADRENDNSIIEDGRISYSNTDCLFVSDDIDSVENLKWHLNLLVTYGR